jgi:hypothetical protein
MPLGSAARDWFLVVVGALFTAAGAFIGVVKHDPKGWGGAVFFGACAAVGIWTIVRRRRIRAHFAALDVQVPGGVPIQAAKATSLVWTGSVAVVGIALSLLGLGDEWFLRAFSVGLAVLGGVLFLLVALGVTPRPALVFEPAGLRWCAGQRSYLLEWDNVARVWPGEIHGHDLLLVDVANHERLRHTASPAYAVRLPKALGFNRGWYGADVVFMPGAYGLDVALLARAMRRYVEHPESRAELAGPPALR